MKKLETIVSTGLKAFKEEKFDLALRFNDKAISHGRLKKVNNHTKELLHSNKGYTLLAMKEYELARQQFALANTYEFNDENGWSQFLCLANLGNWEEAKKFHHYRYGETRSAPTKVSFPKLPLPFAKSLEDLKDKKILILNEQGLGDEILFFSAISKIASLVKEITLQCYPETLRLFQNNCPENVTLFIDRSFNLEFVNQFDIYTNTGDLFIYSSDISLGYSNIVSEQERKGTGFCWKANVKSPNAEKRSIDPDILQQFKSDLNISLQITDECPDWMIPLPEVKDLWDTAEIISGLEHVFTVDTSIAHLCGFLNIPTTLLINKHLDWRWKLVGEYGNSLFYPSINILSL
jgi:hypothetical protein